MPPSRPVARRAAPPAAAPSAHPVPPPRAFGQVLVSAQGLAKTYAVGDVKTRALDGVDLDVRAGEMVAIMGPSGCGKTTLLNCLSGLEAPSAGRVSVSGTDLWAMSDNARTRFRARTMGFVFQAYNLLPVLTGEENVELPLLVSGLRPREARTEAQKALAMVGLVDRGHHRPQQLSGGQQQRVAIARSLVHDPPIVWADEPTGNLDTATGRDIVDLVVRLNRETGKTFVIVTHDADIASRCDRIVRMDSGRILDGPAVALARRAGT